MADPVAAGVAELGAMLASFVKDNRLYGAAAGVVHGNELAWSDGAGFADAAAERQSSADTLYRIASITKTFTGTAILQLRDEARLNLDDAAVRWIQRSPSGGCSRTNQGWSASRLAPTGQSRSTRG
jgi:CubicO group peptidase (beta-lactamase class C family)